MLIEIQLLHFVLTLNLLSNFKLNFLFSVFLKKFLIKIYLLIREVKICILNEMKLHIQFYNFTSNFQADFKENKFKT